MRPITAHQKSDAKRDSAEAEDRLAGNAERLADGVDLAVESARVRSVPGGATQPLQVARPPVVEELHGALADVLADHRRERDQLVLVFRVHQELDRAPRDL